MKSILTVTFVRHGETDWNAERRAQGLADIPLNAIGRMQAHALAERLAKEPWDAIYSSDLSRARETAQIIAQPLGLNVQENIILRERDQGQIEGTTQDERLVKWGENWHELNLGIEDNESLYRRGMSFLNSMMAEYGEGEKRIIAVAHGGLIGFTLRKLVPQVATGAVGNTSISTLQYADKCWECSLYNCMIHITPELLLTK